MEVQREPLGMMIVTMLFIQSVGSVTFSTWWVDCVCFDRISSYVIVHIDCDTTQALSTIQAK